MQLVWRKLKGDTQEMDLEIWAEDAEGSPDHTHTKMLLLTIKVLKTKGRVFEGWFVCIL